MWQEKFFNEEATFVILWRSSFIQIYFPLVEEYMSAIQISLAEKIQTVSLLPTSHLNSQTELKEVINMPKQRPDFRIRHSHKGLLLL